MDNDSHLTRLRISDIKFPDITLRRHSEAKIKKLAEHLRSAGQVTPIVVDAQLRLVDGLARCRALQMIGEDSVLVLVRNTRTNAESDALGIGLNRLQAGARWNVEGLRDKVVDFGPASVEFTLAVLSERELLPVRPVRGWLSGDAVPSGPLSRAGDTWCLGDNTLTCGREFPHAFKDARHSAKLAFIDLVAEREIDGFYVSDALRCVPSLCPAFIRTPMSRLESTLVGARENGQRFLDLCVWPNETALSTRVYTQEYEIFVLVSEDATVQRRHHEKKRSGIWRHEVPSEIETDFTPSELPRALMKNMLGDFTKRREVVVAPFVGRGEFVLAAQACGRRCMAFEPSAALVDIAVLSWQRLTGEAASHLATGDTFEQVAGSRITELEGVHV